MTVKTTKENQELDIERGSLTIQHKYVDLKLLQKGIDTRILDIDKKVHSPFQPKQCITKSCSSNFESSYQHQWFHFNPMFFTNCLHPLPSFNIDRSRASTRCLYQEEHLPNKEDRNQKQNPTGNRKDHRKRLHY